MTRYNDSKWRGLQRLLLIARDGNKCAVCGVAGFESPILREDGTYDMALIYEYQRDRASKVLSKKVCERLDVEHKDQKQKIKRNTPIKDLHLTCHSCNLTLFYRANPRPRRASASSGRAPICEPAEVGDSHSFSEVEREEREPSSGQVRRNRVLKEAWPKFLTVMLEEDVCTVDRLTVSLAPYMRRMYDRPWGSAETCRRYVEEEVLSPWGLLKERWQNGVRSVEWRSAEIRGVMRKKWLTKKEPLEESSIGDVPLEVG